MTTHTPAIAPPPQRAAAIEAALQAHGLDAKAGIEQGVHNAEDVWLPELGARVVAKAECSELFASGEEPEAYFTRKGMIQVQDAGQLTEWVKQAIAAEPKVVADVQGGKLAALGRLVGVTMKLSGGKR